MTDTFVRSDEGQALVVVGVALAVLMGTLVLTVDWGYGLAMRRAAQNQADAATLAAGRLLATSYSGPGPAFAVSQEDVWNAACEARQTNTPAGPVRVDRRLEVSFLDGGGSSLSSFASRSEVCTLTGITDVPIGTIFVRVRSEAAYTSLFAVVTRQSIQTAASARARLSAGVTVRQLRLPTGVPFPVGAPGVGLSGESTAPNVAIWPIVRRYNPADWSATAPRTFQLIGPGALATSYFVSLSHFSPHEADHGREVHQLITESDYTGSPNPHHGHTSVPPMVSSIPGCPGGTTWNSNGSANLDVSRTCDIPNWFYYGYRGSLAVGTDWASSTWASFSAYGSGQEAPAPLPPAPLAPGTRSSCSVLTSYPYFSAPSCSAPTLGDWVETVTGVDTTTVANQVLSFITRYGRDVLATGGGSEKAVVVNLFLWDCGESFTPVPLDPRANWNLNGAGGDCSTASGAADRVHLFTAVPLTIRESDVLISASSHVTARWGGIFGDPGNCVVEPTPPGCGLNPLINSAFLVPDE
jgi:hypothetical protein